VEESAMNLPSDFWTAASVVVAIVVALSGLGRWLIATRKQEQERDRITKEVHHLAKKSFEGDTVPQVCVATYAAAHFLGYGTVPEGTTYTLRPPKPFVSPIPMLVAEVKNEGKIQVTVARAGIRLERTAGTMELHPPDVDEVNRTIAFPFPLPPRESRKIPIEAATITRMLGVLQAQLSDEFTVWVAEPIGKRYYSHPLRASDYLGEGSQISVEINFENLVTVTQIGEEEYFPEGILPVQSGEEVPNERGRRHPE
jgi:hypothetical protein